MTSLGEIVRNEGFALLVQNDVITRVGNPAVYRCVISNPDASIAETIEAFTETLLLDEDHDPLTKKFLNSKKKEG